MGVDFSAFYARRATYKLSSSLEQTDSERDLGVWVQSNLTWNEQVHYQSEKANKLLGYIRRSTLYSQFKKGCPLQTLNSKP